MDSLTTEVWTLQGVTGSDPAIMTFADGIVRLQVFDNDDNLRQQFAVPVSEISEVNWPKLQMSGGCNLQVNGQKYRLSFLRPQNTRIPVAGAVTGVASISGGRKAGKAWKQVLGS